MSTVHHDIFNAPRVLDTFPNDESSVNEVARLAHLAAKAREEEEKAAKEAEEIKNICARVPVLEAQKKALEARLREVETELKKRTLETKNNLDPACHDRIVSFCLAAKSHTGIDLGGDGGVFPYGYPHHLDNGWHHLRIRKADPSDPQSAWTLFVADRDTYLSCGRDRNLRNTIGRRTEGDAKLSQEWYIGHSKTKPGYVLRLVFGHVLTMDDPYTDRGGKDISAVSPNQNAPDEDSQVFFMIVR